MSGGVSPIEVLKVQRAFLESLVFTTEWGKLNYERLVLDKLEGSIFISNLLFPVGQYKLKLFPNYIK